MKRTLSFILAIAMVVSLGAYFSLNTVAEENYVPDDGSMTNIEIAKVSTAPKMDGKVDASYTKIFDITGADTWYQKTDDDGNINWVRDNHATVDYNKETGRYDAAENPERTSSEWYNSRLEGYASWDATNLYLCVVITTPHKINDNPAQLNSWTGDAMEVAAHNTSRNAACKFVFSQVKGDLQVYPAAIDGLSGLQKRKTYDTTKTIAKNGVKPDGGVYITETGYVYELALDWSVGFGITATENASIPFNVAVNFNNAAADRETSCGIQAGAGIYNEGGKVNLLTKSKDDDAEDIKPEDRPERPLGFAIKLVNSLPCVHANTEWVVHKEFTQKKCSGEERKVCKDCGKVIAARHLNKEEPVAAKEVVDNITAIINYLGDGVTDPVMDGKNIKTLLAERLAAYEADVSDENLVSLIQALKEWATGGYDASKVFFTDKLFGAINSIITYVAENNVTDSSGKLVFEASDYWAKRTTAQLKEHILAVGNELYVEGKAPIDFVSEIDSTVAAMEAADNAADANTAFTGLIDFLNENCMLLSAQDLYDIINTANSLVKNTSGDPELLEILQLYVDELIPEELAAVDEFGFKKLANAGFTQYRAAGQADSFVEDVTLTYNPRFVNFAKEVAQAVDDYKKTLSTDYIIGDVNGDGVVNARDRLDLSRWLAKWPEAIEKGINELAADVNGDGKVNNLDRVVLSRHVAHWAGYETLPCTVK